MVELAARSAQRAGAAERRRREEALQRHRASPRGLAASGGELQYVRTQLHVVAGLAARLADSHDTNEMARLLVDELHKSFGFYLAARSASTATAYCGCSPPAVRSLT
jgi:hypothetical protein